MNINSENSLKIQSNINGIFKENGEFKNYNPPKSKPLPLVIYEEGRFKIPSESYNLLTKQNLKNIGIISLVGKYRTGKSFLLNKVILNSNKNSGFNVGPTIKPCTKGIWIWSDPIMIKNKYCNETFPCFIIDTEGLGAYDEEINQDTKIYLIAILISSLFIYNSFGPIDEPAIETLSFIINLGKTIKLNKNSKENDSEMELIEYFPSLFWLLRDFSLKLEDKNGNEITSKEYLEIALENINGDSEVIEQKNMIRELIKNYFPDRDCFTMIRPVENENDLQKMNNLPDKYFRKEFLEQCEIFRNKIKSKCRPKIFMKNTLTGNMLIELIESVLDSINDGSIPIIENSWKYIIRNECIKTSNDYIKNFHNEINNFRILNKDDPNFVQKIKDFTNDLSEKYINSFLKNKLFDDDSKKEFQDKLKEKLNEEIEKFNMENIGIYRDNFQKSLDYEAKEFLNDMNGKNKEKYKNSYYKFFQDLDEFRENIDKSCPNFEGKNDLIFDKIIDLSKKFFESNFMGNKNEIENELNEYKNQINILNRKLNKANDELFKLKQNNGDILNKLNSDIISEKMKKKNIEEKINILINEKKIIQDNYERQILNMKDDFQKQISEMANLKNQNETDLHIKEKEMVVMKLNNEKINSLHQQKFKFYEREVTNWKDKYNILSKESKSKEQSLLNEIELLKNQIDNLKTEKKYLEKNNKDLANQDMKNLLKHFKDNIKTQNEENRNLFNSILENQKEIEKKDHNEIFKNLRESSYKNQELNNLLNISENKINDLEEQINNLSIYKEMTDNINEVKCKNCLETFNMEEFKEHFENCMNNPDNINKNKLHKNINPEIEFYSNFSPEKLKIKILKGKVKQDEIGKPYLNYIIDIQYNEQNWRINKKFNQFVTLYKSVKNLFKNIIELPQSGNIFLNINDVSNNGSFYENKMQQLEKFIIDLSEIDPINMSKPFLKFLEFDNNYDKDTENYLINNKSMKQENNLGLSMKNPYKKFDNHINNNDDENLNFNYNNKSTSLRNSLYKNQYH